jgi:raffinose/stachyose/melibiose transport system substrate-binding protein
LGANPAMNMGFLPMAINDNESDMDKLPVGVPMNWAINKNSKVKEAAKTFLTWLVTSETGKRYVAKEFKFIPAFKSISADPADLGGLSMDIIKYSKEGKTITWNWFKYPGGDATSQAFANAMQAYIGGKSSPDELLKKFQEGWDQNNKK